MENLLPGLHATPPQPLSFAPTLAIRAFLLERADGNLLLYGTGAVAGERAAIEALGRPVRHYLAHEHEAAFGCGEAGAPLLCHEAGRAAVAGHCPIGETFSGRHHVGGDLEVIPIPGHTPGSTAFLWAADGGARCLFTADTVYLREGGDWVTALLPDSSDRAALIASLELLGGLDFDVLVPWAAARGGPPLARTDRADAQRRLGAIVERLRRGETH